jgi:hypothetical protein
MELLDSSTGFAEELSIRWSLHPAGLQKGCLSYFAIA